MPLPLGHIAIGLAADEVGTTRSAFSRWKLFAAIVVLSNLPDIDVIIGLLFHWNGSAFHRGQRTASCLLLLSDFWPPRRQASGAGSPVWAFGPAFL